MDFVAPRVKFDQWVTPFYSNAFHSLTQVLELEVGARLGALVLLVVVVEVDSLVVVQIHHLRLALALPLHSLNIITINAWNSFKAGTRPYSHPPPG